VIKKYLCTGKNLFCFKKVCGSVRREILLYNILTEFGIAMKIVRLVKMFLAEKSI
jgi:hypothetical protein